MVKLILKGGMGNQMFQYAAIYSLAKKQGFDIGLDLSFMDCKIPVPGFTKREYELDLFGIKHPTFTLLKNPLLNSYFSYPLLKFAMIAKILPSYVAKNIYSFDNNFFNIKDNSYIEGFFNHYQYFEDYKTDIKSVFNTDKLYDKNYKEIEKNIESIDSVSINIRRGDYLNKKHKDTYIYLDKDYYKNAIEIIKNNVKNPHFFIFSYDFPKDDDKYFTNGLGLKKSEITLLGRNYTGHRFKTYLRLISLCKHNITANNTFSFWGAYLNKNAKSTVISPSQWSYQEKTFYAPNNWIPIKPI